ncbi:TPA: flagellar type III secretion system protein FliO [Salmonella enterica subsp. enterica serovar Typhimurium]|nr:flagellar type III secretion system protein FliO [Salmonella enterica subsp. enterica serovar Typhimurium]HBZ5959502.1 flagellar type III secretion system protein FliO [Salmonella enterica subsp. enterica serovar Typhimurium]
MMKTEATVSQPTAPAGSPLMQVSGALIGIIALILAAAWVIKRMGFAPKGNSVRGLKVSASASLGPRERVVMEAPVAPPADFQNMMKSLLKRSGRS